MVICSLMGAPDSRLYDSIFCHFRAPGTRRRSREVREDEWMGSWDEHLKSETASSNNSWPGLHELYLGRYLAWTKAWRAPKFPRLVLQCTSRLRTRPAMSCVAPWEGEIARPRCKGAPYFDVKWHEVVLRYCCCFFLTFWIFRDLLCCWGREGDGGAIRGGGTEPERTEVKRWGLGRQIKGSRSRREKRKRREERE